MKDLFKRNALYITLVMLFTLLSVFFVSIIPLTTKYLIDNYSNLDTNKVIILIVVYIISILLFLLFEYLKKVEHARLEKHFNSMIRERLTTSFLKYEHNDLNNMENGFAVNVLISDNEILYTKYFSCIIDICVSIISFVTYFVIMMLVDWKLALTVLASCFISLVIPKLVGKKLSAMELDQSSKKAKYIEKINEVFNGKSLFSKRTDKALLEDITIANEELEDSTFKLNKEYAFTNIFSGFSLYLINIISFIVGVIFILLGYSDIGSFVAIVAYIDSIAVPTRDIIYEIIDLKSSKAIREKLTSILEYASYNYSLVNSFNKISINNLTYAYDEKVILKDFNFVFEKDKKYVITGKNGSGKSTLIKLISKEIKCNNNMILFDKKDINSIDFSDIGFYGSIDNPIFEGSLLDNITMFGSFENLSDEYLDTLKIRHLVDTHIQAGGINISTGEIEKIQILRAINSNKNLLVFDEIFANIDQESEEKLTDFLLSLKKTIILISHNLDSENLNKFDYQINL